MAIFYMRCGLIRASSGRSAIAASAYQSGASLFDERLGRTFSYRHKEEVVYSEVLLPEHAPSKYLDRQTLWNAVEASQNKANSRYARQFVIATPIEWSREESIERMHDFFQTMFVTKGMVCDWALHDKAGNPHVHCMLTVRGFNEDGSWAAMEKKAYALDEDGNRIPEVDPQTGAQKVRERIRDGRKSIERIWKRITVQANDWNKRQFIMDTKKAWAEYANQFLKPESQIDHRTYAERGIDHVPLLHVGPGVISAQQRGVLLPPAIDNEERKEINRALNSFYRLIERYRQKLEAFRERLIQWREHHDERRSERKNRLAAGDDKPADGLPGYDRGGIQGITDGGREPEQSSADNSKPREGNTGIEGHASAILLLRERLQRLVARNRAVVESIGDIRKRESDIQGLAEKVGELITLREQTQLATEKVRRHRHRH